MKLANLIIGLVIFSVVVTLMFAAAQDFMIQNNMGNSSEWEGLSGGYGEYAGEISKQPNSTMRGIAGATKLGESASETADITFLGGAIAGGKLILNFFTNFNEIKNKVSGDTETYIDNRIFGAILAIILVFLALASLFFLRGFKAET